jgi:carbon storage regulator
MLVITRKPGEEIVIGSNVVVRVLTADYGRVRVGITAPADVTVVRKELLERRLQQQTEDREKT